MGYAYEIFTDLSADIAPEVVAQYGIRMLPMSYMVGDEARICEHFENEETLHAFYAAQRQGLTTKTTQITPQAYKDTFAPLMRDGVSCLYLSLSSGLSGTYAASMLAAEELNEKYPAAKLVPVDTLSATGGIGVLAEQAAINRDKGMTIEENAAQLESVRQDLAHWFMVEDLMHLKRGGRVSAATAIVGTALNIKPILKIAADGTLSSFDKKRGVKSAMAQLVEYWKESSAHEEGERVYVIHADAPERAEALKEAVLAVNPTARVTVTFLCPVIGSHVGPGMCAITHRGKR